MENKEAVLAQMGVEVENEASAEVVEKVEMNPWMRAFMRGMRMAPRGKHSKGRQRPKNYAAKQKARRKMAAKSRARNFRGA